MSYVENNLGKNEVLVKKAERTVLYLFGTWVKGIVFSWLLLIPVFKAIVATIEYFCTDLAITNKRVIGRKRQGLFNTASLDAPLNKVQNVNVSQDVFGKIFNYGFVKFETAGSSVIFKGVKSPDAFKGMIMAQIDEYEEERVKQQAAEMANAMSSVLNKQG